MMTGRGSDDQRGHKHRQHNAQHRQRYLFCGKLYEVFFHRLIGGSG